MLGSMTSQRKLPRAFRGGLGGREWQETVLVVGIMCMGLLLLSTFLLYSISEQQDKGELDTVLVDFAAGKHRCSLCQHATCCASCNTSAIWLHVQKHRCFF